jgi:DNA-directed RNA polymerase subunit N (RpoN/RPB10)
MIIIYLLIPLRVYTINRPLSKKYIKLKKKIEEIKRQQNRLQKNIDKLEVKI